MTLWTQKSISRLLEDTQASRWTHGCPQPGRGIGPSSILPTESPRASSPTFRREKTQKHISLHKTAGRQQMKNHRCWSPRPNRRQNLPANHPSVRQCQLNKVRYRNGPRMEKPLKRTIKEMSPAGSWSDPVIVASSGDETDTADEFQLDSLSLQSPPDHQRGYQPLQYVPKSPVYPPPRRHFRFQCF